MLRCSFGNFDRQIENSYMAIDSLKILRITKVTKRSTLNILKIVINSCLMFMETVKYSNTSV